MATAYKRVALLSERTVGYHHEVLLGLRDFKAGLRNWRCHFMHPHIENLELLSNWQPDGIIAFVYDQNLEQGLIDLGHPCVNVANWGATALVPRVGVDDVAVGRLASEHLLETGIVHFGFLGHKSLAFSDDRWKGFHTGLARYGYKASRYDLDPSEAHLRPWTIGEVQDSLKSWMRELPKPFALFCDNDERALTALEICEELDIDVPNQMAVLGVDYDPYLAALSYPPLSSIVIPARRVGYEAALLLNRLMVGAKPPTQAILKEPIGVIKNRSTDVLAIPDPLLRKAIHYIRDHAADDLRIDDIADHTQVSRRKLETLFRKHLDRSPLEEVRSVRIRIAQNLLATTDFTLETIAEKTGFGTANWLSANFSKVCGISPGRYRRKIQGHSDQDSSD